MYGVLVNTKWAIGCTRRICEQMMLYTAACPLNLVLNNATGSPAQWKRAGRRSGFHLGRKIYSAVDSRYSFYMAQEWRAVRTFLGVRVLCMQASQWAGRRRGCHGLISEWSYSATESPHSVDGHPLKSERWKVDYMVLAAPALFWRVGDQCSVGANDGNF